MESGRKEANTEVLGLGVGFQEKSDLLISSFVHSFIHLQHIKPFRCAGCWEYNDGYGLFFAPALPGPGGGDRQAESSLPLGLLESADAGPSKFSILLWAGLSISASEGLPGDSGCNPYSQPQGLRPAGQYHGVTTGLDMEAPSMVLGPWLYPFPLGGLGQVTYLSRLGFLSCQTGTATPILGLSEGFKAKGSS